MLSSEEKWGWSMSGEKHVSERSVLSALGVEKWGVNRAVRTSDGEISHRHDTLKYSEIICN